MDVSFADPSVAAFIVIPVVLVGALLWGTATAWRRSGATTTATGRAVMVVGALALAWMAVTWTIADRGILRSWDRTPPPFFLLVLSIVVISSVIAFGSLGRHLARYLPLWILVAVQAFRLPLELAMHAMAERGIMPIEMTYTGRNFDIVTGITAIVVAAVLFANRTGHADRNGQHGRTGGGNGGSRGGGVRTLVLLWNLLGLGLLFNVVIVAVLATPRFRYFGDSREHLNVFVTYPPFIWLPAVMVLAALAGHLLIFRALRLQPR
jgi:hypothetical protein